MSTSEAYSSIFFQSLKSVLKQAPKISFLSFYVNFKLWLFLNFETKNVILSINLDNNRNQTKL